MPCSENGTAQETGAGRRLLQADAPEIMINDYAKVVDTDLHGGKAIIHIIDHVLVPSLLTDVFNVTELNETTAVNVTVPAGSPAATAARSSASSISAALALAVPAVFMAFML